MIPLPTLFTYKFKKDWRIDKKKSGAKSKHKNIAVLKIMHHSKYEYHLCTELMA
jgi:hypothetical protein